MPIAVDPGMDLLGPDILEAIDNPAAAVGFVAAAVVGIASSLHCFFMCGPLACAGLATRGARERRWAAIAAYQAARFFSYTLVGALLGALGGTVATALTLRIRPWLPWVMVAVLVATALDLGRHLPAVPGLGRLSAKMGRLSAGLSPVWRSAAIGAFTPLLPCGLLYGILAAALLAGSFGGGALVTAGFALGSAPALLGAQAGAGLWRRLPRPAALAMQRGIPLLAAGIIAWRMVRMQSGDVSCH